MARSAFITGGLDRHFAKEAKKDRLKSSDRAGNVIGAICTLVFALYFVVLYNSGSEFFASDITNVELTLFFWVVFYGIAPSLMKAILGKKNVTRPLEVIVSLSTLIALALYLSSFPFDFNHLGDSLPESLEFLVSWIDNGIARFAMWLGVIVSVVMIPYTLMLYFGVRKKLMRTA
jgi:tetrahydromethanopterin S-methyltransferase subunit F